MGFTPSRRERVRSLRHPPPVPAGVRGESVMSVTFNVGDDVQFVKITRTGRTITMATKFGTITDIVDACADVRVTSRKTYRVELSALKHKHERGHLTELFKGPQPTQAG